MKIAVLGAGGWGTALARLLAQNHCDVTLWGHDAAHLQEVHRTRHNERYLPGITLPRGLKFATDVQVAAEGCDVVVVAVPSKAFREVTASLSSFRGIVVSVTKGIEYDSGLTMCGILQDTAPDAGVAALSGPTLAKEVAQDIPAAIVAASEDPEVATTVQKLFHCPSLRVYTNSDLIGVELGGALKNVIAIGAGVCDGLGFGDNSKAALVTRAISEISRLGVACGAKPETFAGLSGLGDLTVTCFSKLSRNRAFGEQLGKGLTPAAIISTTKTVAEGYPTARSAYQLARRLDVSTPIIDEMYAMLHQGKNVAQAVRDLMGRDSKSETE